MTDEMMSLRALVEKAPDADVLREMVGFAAERLAAPEIEAKTGAGYRERRWLIAAPDRAAGKGARSPEFTFCPAATNHANRAASGAVPARPAGRERHGRRLAEPPLPPAQRVD